MKKPRAILFLLLIFSIFSAPALAVKQEMDFLEGSQQRVSIDLRESDIVDVLKFLAQKGKFNIYIDPGIAGRVTLLLEDVRIADILDIILLSNGLAYREKDSIVYIMAQEEYKTRYGEQYGDAREVELIKLQYASPAQIFKMIEPTKSSMGSIVIDEKTGTVILMDMSEKIMFMKRVIAELDQPLETVVFDISYSKAEDLATLLKTKLGSDSGDLIQADVRSNQIMVTSLPNRIKEIEGLIAKLDRKTREVTIDAQIVKIDLSKDRRKGIEWEKLFRRGILEPLDLNLSLSNSNITSSLGSVTYNQLSQQNAFTTVFKFLESMGDSRILARPSITVIEGEEAKILIGSREAYVTSTTTTGSTGSATVSENVSFIDVGTSLSVSALINKEGFVTMKIKPEVSSVRTSLTTSQKNLIPIVDTTQAETRVMVKDGTTIVIGGLRKDQMSDTSNRIPFLADIPIAGNLFKQQNKELDQSELVVFLTPHIIGGERSTRRDSDMDAKGIRVYSEDKDKKAVSKGPRVDITATRVGSGGSEIKALQAYPSKTLSD